MGFGGEGGFSAGASARAVTGVGDIGGNLPLFMMVLRVETHSPNRPGFYGSCYRISGWVQHLSYIFRKPKHAIGVVDDRIKLPPY